MTEWMGIGIAVLSLVISGFTWQAQRRDRQQRLAAEQRANVTVFFHWLPHRAQVKLANGEMVKAGYHLVLFNAGPARATNVQVEMTNANNELLTLVDLGPAELPLDVLDTGARYPIPWVYEPFKHGDRAFKATLHWIGADGIPAERTIPLRRGKIPDGSV